MNVTSTYHKLIVLHSIFFGRYGLLRKESIRMVATRRILMPDRSVNESYTQLAMWTVVYVLFKYILSF